MLAVFLKMQMTTIGLWKSSTRMLQKTSRTVKVKTQSLPWVDGNVRKLMNQRYRKLQKAQRTNDPKDREEYIKLRNKVNRTAESRYWKRLLEEKENGSKNFWKIV